MRIVNTGFVPKYLSYGDSVTGGKTLNPGQESRDLPLSYIHAETLWKDIDRGVVQIRFNDSDRAFLAKAMAAGDKPITMLVPPAPPAPPPPPPPPPPKPALEPVLKVEVPPVVTTPGQDRVQEMIDNMKYRPLVPPAKHAPSLSDLMKANKDARAPIPGMPAFVDPAKKASMSEISTHIGGLV